MEHRWPKYVQDRTQVLHYYKESADWWDKRYCKVHSSSPDFRRKSSKEALWIRSWNTPQWVVKALARKTSLKKSDASTDGIIQAAVDLTVSQRDEFSWTTLMLKHTKSGQAKEALRIYEEMQMGGVDPSSYTFVAALKACISLKNLASTKRVHANVVKHGFQSHVYVGTMLVDAYVKCGSLVDARNVFEKMLHRNEVAWNSMILGYAQREGGEVALELYGRMQEEGLVPNERTFVAALKACSSLAPSEEGSEGDVKHGKRLCLKQVRAIHLDVLKSGCESNVFVGNMLVDVYAKLGSLLDARQVFDRMRQRNVVSWTTMILAYTQMEQGELALQMYAQMQQDGVQPDDRAFLSALKACSSLVVVREGYRDDKVVKQKCLEQVRAIHSDIVRGQFNSDVFVGATLVDVYAKCGSLTDARHVFEKMPLRNVVCWSSMILAYVHIGEGKIALELFSRMEQEGLVPNERTFIGILKACGSLATMERRDKDDHGESVKKHCLEKVRIIHTQLKRGGFESDIFVRNNLVDVYAKCGSLMDARQVFEKGPVRNVVSWNTIILGYAQIEEGEVALELYARMQQEGVSLNDRTFVAALRACSSLSTVDKRNVHGGSCVKQRYLERVRAIHTEVLKSGYEADLFVGNMLVDVYAKCGSLVDATLVFQRMPHRDIVSWTAIILAYAQADKGAEALDLYRRMQQEGQLPNERTFVGALMACGSVAGLEKGMEVHAQISKVGLEATDLFVRNSLIDMYGKCGSMVDAQKVFDSLPRRDIVTWTALLAGYARHGESKLVFDVFQRMRQEGIQPDGITFLSILTVCSHGGLVDKGQNYFEAMSRDFGIRPTIEHYTCMVDLLGRAGQVANAMSMVKKMPFQPDVTVWKTVLGACRKWRNMELAKQAFECAVKLDKKDPAAYVLMSNIYAAAHRWEDAKEIQATRVQIQAWKQPGESWWTDMSGTVHVFMVGDREHPESPDIYAKLRNLFDDMKGQGYVPHLDSVLRNIPADEKEDALCGHSEKLAIAYALLKTPRGTTIRVVKNLRVCEDCHTATKLISKIEQRTIICRDANRFHVYKDGKCTCGDYW